MAPFANFKILHLELKLVFILHFVFTYYVLCSSGVAGVHLFVAAPHGTVCSFENLQNLFVQFAKPQIII